MNATQSAIEGVMPQSRWRAGVALVSFSSMLLELALTRLFSVVLFYHFAFLAISIALLGLGGGGVFAYLRRAQLSKHSTERIAGLAAMVASVAIVGVLVVVLHARIPLMLDWRTFWQLTAVYLCSAVPFACAGVAMSVVFSRGGARVPQLYGADLAGAAVACIAVVPLLDFIGGPNAILASALVFAIASAVWTLSPADRRSLASRASWIVAVVLLVLIAGNLRGRIFDIVYAKGMFRDRHYVEFAKWNAISRVEVDDQGGAKAIVIDADASTYIMGVEPEKWQDTEWQKNLMSAAPSPVNVLRPKGEFAIIGPGGGVDVLRAVANGSPSVTGIEINPLIATEIMRRDPRYVAYSRGLYLRPDVHIHVSDGRSYVRHTSEQFDVVQMTLVDTWASTAAGAFALSENNLYTVEAFDEYFAHLKPDGMLAITRWEFKRPREALRVVSNAIEALHRLGVEDPSNNVIVVSDGPLNLDGRPVLVLAKKSAFTMEEEQKVAAHLAAHQNLVLIYAPHDRTRSIGANPNNPEVPWNPFTALLVSNEPRAFAQKYAFNVAPVFDNAPFFFFTIKPADLWAQTAGLDRGIDWKVNLGVAVLAIVLVLSVVAVAAFLLGPMAVYAPARSVGVSRLLYFVAIGLGYIVVEIAFIQRFVLFLGHPIYALTVVVFLMLLASGAGSMASRRWIRRPRSVWRVALVIAVAIAIYAALLPVVLHALIGWPIAAKIAVSVLLLAPPAFLMGMPFPAGLREVSSGDGDSAVEWGWAVNAGASVLGSVLAIVLALQFGLVVATLVGAACYAAAAACTRSFTIVER